MIKKMLVTLSGVIGFSTLSEATTITIDPSELNQTVKFGADVKLTLKRVDDGNTEKVMDRFTELGMDMLRVPIYTTREMSDSFYDRVYRVSDIAENKGLKIFASVANGDGDQNNNLHHAEKFGSFLKCNCPYNVYNLNISAYSSYLDEYLMNMELNDAKVDVLGPYNEDNAANSDYSKIWGQMTNRDFQRIGVETWALQAGINKTPEVSDQLDIIGAHFYDDSAIPVAQHDEKWAEFVSAAGEKPAWFTESTRYEVSGASAMAQARMGIEHFIPAIRGGVERVIVYQTANRIVWYNGGVRPYRFSSLKHFIQNAKGPSVASETDDLDIKTVSFASEDNLSVHVTNSSSENKTVTLNLTSDFGANGTVTRTVWEEGVEGVANKYVLGGNSRWNVMIPANSYVHFDIEGVFNAVVDSDEDGIEDELDNCPFIANPEQENFDFDDFGDACDDDDDNDSLADSEDACPMAFADESIELLGVATNVSDRNLSNGCPLSVTVSAVFDSAYDTATNKGQFMRTVFRSLHGLLVARTISFPEWFTFLRVAVRASV